MRCLAILGLIIVGLLVGCSVVDPKENEQIKIDVYGGWLLIENIPCSEVPKVPSFQEKCKSIGISVR